MDRKPKIKSYTPLFLGFGRRLAVLGDWLFGPKVSALVTLGATVALATGVDPLIVKAVTGGYRAARAVHQLLRRA